MEIRNVKFGEYSTFKGGKQPPKSSFKYKPTDGYVRLLQIRDFSVRAEPTYVSIKNNLTYVKSDDILIARYGASVGKILTGLEGAINVAIIKTEPKNGLDKRYLYHFLKTPSFQSHIKGIQGRMAQAGFDKSALVDIEIPLPFSNGIPDLTEQKRIADNLDKIFGNIEKGLTTVAQEDNQTTALKQSLLSNIFHNTNWQTQKLSDIAEVNPKKDFRALQASTEVSFVPMDSVDEITGTVTKKLTRTLDAVSKGYTFFRNEDVIFAKITPCMENGKCAVAKNLTNGVGFGSTEFYVVRAKENILPEYLWHFLRQECVRKEATHHFTGAAGHKRVPKDFIENLELPIPFKNGKPDLAEQRRAIEDLDKVFAFSEKIAGLLNKQKQSFTSLRSSVLSQSFQLTT